MIEERVTSTPNPENRSSSKINIARVKQYLVSFIVSFGGFSLGVCMGWNSSSSESLKNYVNADSTELGLVGVIFNLGVCVSLGLLPFILKKFSRIGTMTMAVPIIFLGWGCIAFAGQTVPLMIFGRILCGFSGIFCVLVPIYLGEIAEKKIRGQLIAVFQLMINIGIMFAYSMACLIVEEKTIWLYTVICALTTAPLALVILVPESPTYHILNENERQAKISLEYFRGKDYEYIEREIEDMKKFAAIKKSKKVSFGVFVEKRILRSLVVSFGVMVIHQFSGMNLFIFNILALFNAEGSADLSSNIQILIVGLAQIISSVITIIFIDKFGRKILLIVSSSTCGIFLFLLGWFFKIEQEDPEYADKISWMSLTWITLLFTAFNLGVGPIAWIYLIEIFPYHVKLEASISMTILNWFMSLCLTLSFGMMLDGMGQVNTMWFFAGFCWCGTIFILLFIKETKLIDLSELEEENLTENRTEL